MQFQSPTAVSWPKIIGPERNVNLICNSSLNTHIHGDIDLIFGIRVYNDELQIKFTCRSGSMIFGRVMALGLKFGQIFSCHHLSSSLYTHIPKIKSISQIIVK
jgi:hypothetical protein